MELAGKVSDMTVSEAPGLTEEEEKAKKEGEGVSKEAESVEGESPSSQAASSFPSMTSSRSTTSLHTSNNFPLSLSLSTGSTVQTQ